MRWTPKAILAKRLAGNGLCTAKEIPVRFQTETRTKCGLSLTVSKNWVKGVLCYGSMASVWNYTLTKSNWRNQNADKNYQNKISTMKTLLTILLICYVSIEASAQSPDLPKSAEGKVAFETVIDSPLKKEALYKNAQTWIAKTFGDYKSVIQFEDKEAGRLILKGNSDLITLYHPKFRYVITIDVKDAKYRSVLTDLELGFGFRGESISYHPYDQMKSDNQVMADYDGKISALKTEQAASKKGQAKVLQRKIDQEEKDKKDYEIRASDQRAQINDTVVALFASLKTSMNKKDDF
jgi:hypothetical protein